MHGSEFKKNEINPGYVPETRTPTGIDKGHYTRIVILAATGERETETETGTGTVCVCDARGCEMGRRGGSARAT